DQFAAGLSPRSRHVAFPVFEDKKLLGAVSLWSIVRVPPEDWSTTTVRELIDPRILTVSPDCDVSEAARLLLSQYKQPMLLVVSGDQIKGVVTKTDILQTLKIHRDVPLEM